MSFPKYTVIEAARHIKVGSKKWVGSGCRGIVQSVDSTHAKVLFAGRRAPVRVPLDSIRRYAMTAAEERVYNAMMNS